MAALERSKSDFELRTRWSFCFDTLVSINKNKLFFWAVVIAALNPIFAGLIIGLVLLSEPDFRKEGKIVTAFSIVWGLMAMALFAKFQGSLPFLP